MVSILDIDATDADNVSMVQICYRVIALDGCQYFTSSQYLSNKRTEFSQILYMTYDFLQIDSRGMALD